MQSLCACVCVLGLRARLKEADSESIAMNSVCEQKTENETNMQDKRADLT